MRRNFLPLTLALALAAPAAAAAADQPPPRIIGTGEGESTIAPDMALLSLSVMREAATAREALTANNDAMAAVISALQALGVAERDRQAGWRPEFQRPEQRADQLLLGIHCAPRSQLQRPASDLRLISRMGPPQLGL